MYKYTGLFIWQICTRTYNAQAGKCVNNSHTDLQSTYNTINTAKSPVMPSDEGRVSSAYCYRWHATVGVSTCPVLISVTFLCPVSVKTRFALPEVCQSASHTAHLCPFDCAGFVILKPTPFFGGMTKNPGTQIRLCWFAYIQDRGLC